MSFQTAWSKSTPGEVHATFAGHITICGKYVFEAKPEYDSKAAEVTCQECASALTPAEGEWKEEEPDFWRMSDAKGESIGYVKSEWDSGWNDGDSNPAEVFAATWFYAYKSVGDCLSTYIARFLTLDEAKSAVEYA